MQILALAIYVRDISDEKSVLERVDSSPPEKNKKPRLGLFQKMARSEDDFLGKVDDIMLGSDCVKNMGFNEIYPFHSEKSHAYFNFCKFHLKEEDQELMLAIVSQKPILLKELERLFHNMKMIYRKPGLNVTLDQMMLNPIGYLGSIELDAIIERLKEANAKAIENLEMLINRGEQIHDLVRKSEELSQGAIKFDKATKVLDQQTNWCCSRF